MAKEQKKAVRWISNLVIDINYSLRVVKQCEEIIFFVVDLVDMY